MIRLLSEKDGMLKILNDCFTALLKGAIEATVRKDLCHIMFD